MERVRATLLISSSVLREPLLTTWGDRRASRCSATGSVADLGLSNAEAIRAGIALYKQRHPPGSKLSPEVLVGGQPPLVPMKVGGGVGLGL